MDQDQFDRLNAKLNRIAGTVAAIAGLLMAIALAAAIYFYTAFSGSIWEKMGAGVAFIVIALLYSRDVLKGWRD